MGLRSWIRPKQGFVGSGFRFSWFPSGLCTVLREYHRIKWGCGSGSDFWKGYDTDHDFDPDPGVIGFPNGCVQPTGNIIGSNGVADQIFENDFDPDPGAFCFPLGCVQPTGNIIGSNGIADPDYDTDHDFDPDPGVLGFPVGCARPAGNIIGSNGVADPDHDTDHDFDLDPGSLSFPNGCVRPGVAKLDTAKRFFLTDPDPLFLAPHLVLNII